MIKQFVDRIEKQMMEKLQEIRATFAHSGNKGTNVEATVRDFLTKYLPRRYAVGNGEVIDSHGNRSGQVDIVVVNEFHPFTFTPDTPGIFFIEGVVAAGEVKAVLTSGELENAIKNAIKFKKLRMNIGKSAQIYSTNESDIKRYYATPPFFLFCFESQLSLSTIVSNINNYIANNVVEVPHTIDAIFVLGVGTAQDLGDGHGIIGGRSENGERVTGWMRAELGHSLFNFLGWLSLTIPIIVRWEPILKEYLYNYTADGYDDEFRPLRTQ